MPSQYYVALSSCVYVMDVGAHNGDTIEPGDELVEINKRRVVQAAMSDLDTLLERVPV